MNASEHGPELGELPKTNYSSESIWLIALVIVVGNLAGTLGAADQLWKLRLQNLLKDVLHLTPEDSARFLFFTGLFFYLKPLAGILTDAIPLFKTRRRYYLLFSSVLAAVAWVVLGFLPRTYGSLMFGVILVNLFVVMISTVSGAFLVEVGQSRGEVGKLTAIRQATRSLLSTIQGPLGGFLAGSTFMIASGMGAFVVLSIFPIAYFFLKEKAIVRREPHVLQNAGRQLRVIANSKPFWLAIVFLGLYYFAPGLGQLMYFRQRGSLGMSNTTIGFLGADANVAGIAAALCYFYFAKRAPLRLSLAIAVATSAASALVYVLYNSPTAAFAIDFQGGFFGGYASVAFLDLAARATPAGCEGLGYSFIMSIMNLSHNGSDWFGSHLAVRYHLSWNSMVSLNAGTTLLVIVLLPLLPKAILASRDNQVPNLENTGEPEAA